MQKYSPVAPVMKENEYQMENVIENNECKI